jgi:hypothetical protein
VAYKSDSSQANLGILVDGITTPVAADVQGLKIIDGTPGSGAYIPGTTATGLLTDVSRIQAAVVVTGAAGGSVVVAQARPSTSTVTRVSASITSTSIIVANASRRDLLLYNESTSILYLLFGTGVASVTNYTIQIAGGGYYEVSYGYTGALKGIWLAANGAVQVTELT